MDKLLEPMLCRARCPHCGFVVTTQSWAAKLEARDDHADVCPKTPEHLRPSSRRTESEPAAGTGPAASGGRRIDMLVDTQ